MLRIIDNIINDGFVDMIKSRRNGSTEEMGLNYDKLMKSCMKSNNDHSYLFLECFRELQRMKNIERDGLYLYWIEQTMELNAIKCFNCLIGQIKGDLNEDYQLEKKVMTLLTRPEFVDEYNKLTKSCRGME
ncbi:Hypothetical protein ORPV_939 [Orpheovirus IHUMI-LCC2]|uniref:Uncharacterized protein n=1 Tax=Orpheovirus IHUMI-LCC2 TaxID=2023057 RepID=A0A2I2L5N3_9VIRU|nr:Hypothetical protein ORPV_939 [Orpheovirus IHUMI-LCC2]SNW62843.1 Hypothetical protein ORPV_939 [Orpheovirus IHUMI-LCC2]